MSSKIIEIEGKTIDNAIEKACRDFGVHREKLNIEIISEGSGGFLGLGAKKAKIRASMLSFEMDFSLSSPTTTDGSETKKRDDKPHGSLVASKNEPKPEIKAEIKQHPKRSEKPDTKTDMKVEARRDTRPHEEHRAAKPAPSTHPAKIHTPRPARPAEPKPANPPAHGISKPPAPEIPPVEAVEATTPAALKARDMLADILTKMTFHCEVKAMETDDMVILSIEGGESGLLIGRRGQNLDALQYILNKAVNKADTNRKLIVVDSEDYRKRRQESLLNMAQRISDKVKKTQKPLSLAHMNAHDRRIIHLALQEDESLVTKSRGEGEFRKVIVLPAKKSSADGAARTKSRS